ncbi:MAG: LuxR C-terminal-related transcriptional regulator [Porphyromonas sp.]|nr:LuxR C-terminal-related transcriptional regulator [Porphyromonas sp.]
MASSRTHIAIVISETLRRAGLEFILRSVGERCLIDTFDSFQIFSASDTERYNIVYMEDTLILLNEEALRGRKFRIVPIYTNRLPYPDSTEDVQGICTQWDAGVIREILAQTLKKKAYSPSMAKDLSLREIEVLKEVSLGRTNKEIADLLDISMNTVMTHRKNITTKLGIKTVSGLTFYALMNGILSSEEVESVVGGEV